MKFISIIIISSISFSVFAADCVEQAMAYSLFNKLQGKITNQLEDKSDQLCKDAPGMSDEWIEATNGSNKLVKIIKNDLSTKKKTNTSYFYELDLEGNLVTEADICKGLNKKIDSSDGCNPNASVMRELLQKNILGMSLSEACSYIVPAVKKAASDCGKLNADAPKREAPGEEISPAEEPAPKKSLFSEKGIQQPTESTGKAKVKSHSGSGASSQ